MHFKTSIKGYKEEIDKELTNFFQSKKKEAENVSPEIIDLIEQIEKVVMNGGKRIRPILFIAAFKAFSDQPTDKIINTSISLELLHNSLLIHDDIMDNADVRHNAPTIHKVYEEKSPVIQNKAEYGKNMAIIAGDLLFGYGNLTIAESDFPELLKQKVIAKYNQTMAETCAGQVLDLVESLRSLPNAKKQAVEKINFYKTSKYTFENPLIAGAILADADQQQITILKEYAINMGLAFQIQDNILGIFSTEEKLGKPVDSDIKEGKKSMIILHALENSTEEQKNQLLKIFGNQDTTSDDVEKVREILKKTGSFDYANNLAHEYIDKAISALDSLKANQESVDFLRQFAIYLKNREY